MKTKKQKTIKEKCIHCGKKCRSEEGRVCDKCYSKYTPGMLNDCDDD